jgi:hypothetical protein
MGEMNENVIDLSKAIPGYRGYSISNLKKKSIYYEGNYYLVKYPTRNLRKTHELQVSSYMSSSISEHAGCRIFKSIGIPAQETMLGYDRDTLVVACKDFVDRDNHYQLLEFGMLANNCYSTSEIGRIPSVELVYDVMKTHPLLSDIQEEAINRYWETMLVDSIVANFDRHIANWGYISNEKFKNVRLAPVYDCGSCLYPKLDDGRLKETMADPKVMDDFVFKYPAGQIRLTETGKKLTFKELFLGEYDRNCTKALGKTVPKIDMNKIDREIEDTPFISDNRADFLKAITRRRFESIVLPAYKKLHSSFYFTE